MSAQLERIEQIVLSLAQRVSGLESKLDEVGSRVSKVEGLRSDLAEVGTSVSGLESKLEEDLENAVWETRAEQAVPRPRSSARPRATGVSITGAGLRARGQSSYFDID